MKHKAIPIFDFVSLSTKEGSQSNKTKHHWQGQSWLLPIIQRKIRSILVKGGRGGGEEFFPFLLDILFVLYSFFYRSGDNIYSSRINNITNTESSWSGLVYVRINCLLSLMSFELWKVKNWDFLSDHHASSEKKGRFCLWLNQPKL